MRRTETYTLDGLYIVADIVTDPGIGPTRSNPWGEPGCEERELVSVAVDCPDEWADACEEWDWDPTDLVGYARSFSHRWQS